MEVNVIGAGLAGSEAALQLAKQGFKVNLYEMRPVQKTGAHTTEDCAEFVCSNSLGSYDITNGSGLLKHEMELLGGELIAKECQVPAGNALAIDRHKFSQTVTEKIKQNPNINLIREEVTQIPEGPTIIASGPLTSSKFTDAIKEFTKSEYLHFFDAIAPIVEKDSINFDIAFWASRYDKGEASYINCPMNKEQYENFYNILTNAPRIEQHDFEKGAKFFESCLPIEVLASRGIDTLRFGPLKPVGFDDPRTGRRPYAVVQLRQDNEEGTIYNIVGFQTNLKFGEQKRVFSMIPGLENADFVKHGVMHRNTYINSPVLLDNTYNLKSNPNIFFAGQITGVEGYVESISSGLVAGINAVQRINNLDVVTFDEKTMIGALAKYISTPNDKFQPMNANFGIVPELGEKIKDKKLKYGKLANRALENLKI
mgnify:CR=1 FL=1